ncbi:MAG: hypothetical protein MPN21_12335, partial [Thermoanaerobaculia bacterium]|nr:hypothetical protein [Thermoanaerobaculia bacterium]
STHPVSSRRQPILGCDEFLSNLLDVHHALVNFGDVDRIEIKINSDEDWFTVFQDGFEDGTTDAWDATSP